MNAEELYFIWLHFTGKDFEKKVKGKEINNEEFYKFIDKVRDLKYKMCAPYDIGELLKLIERIMIKKPLPKNNVQ